MERWYSIEIFSSPQVHHLFQSLQTKSCFQMLKRSKLLYFPASSIFPYCYSSRLRNFLVGTLYGVLLELSVCSFHSFIALEYNVIAQSVLAGTWVLNFELCVFLLSNLRVFGHLDNHGVLGISRTEGTKWQFGNITYSRSREIHWNDFKLSFYPYNIFGTKVRCVMDSIEPSMKQRYESVDTVKPATPSGAVRTVWAVVLPFFLQISEWGVMGLKTDSKCLQGLRLRSLATKWIEKY